MIHTTSVLQGLLDTSSEKAPVSVACGGESPLDGICLSEADKTAVLTLIREEVKFPFCLQKVPSLPHLSLQVPILWPVWLT